MIDPAGEVPPSAGARAEPARNEHDPVPSSIDRDGAPMHIDRCKKCGAVVVERNRDSACPGRNRQLAEFEEERS